jgi:hypothetical protein
MLLHILVIGCPIEETQHGFVPGRGTMTAWKEILMKTIKSPNIYEIDLKQCFPSINLVRLRKVLEQRYSLPVTASRFYQSLNFSLPVLPKELLIKQDQQFSTLRLAAKKQLLGMDITLSDTKDHMPWPFLEEFTPNTYYFEFHNITQTGFKEPDLDIGMDTEVVWNFCESLKVDGYSEYKHFRHLRNSVKKHIDEGLPGTPRVDITNIEALKFIGTVQGSPLSPYLSAIVISEIDRILPKGIHVVKYADDMVFYGPKLKEFVANGTLEAMLQEIGLTLSKDFTLDSSNAKKEKTGWVKYDGKWLKELSFLGLTYNGTIRQLRSTTRKGNTLIYDKEAMMNNLYDIKFSRRHTLLELQKIIKDNLEKAISLVQIGVGGFVINLPIVKDIIAYNLAQTQLEMMKIRIAAEGQQHFMELLIFIRFLFALPRRILWGLEIRKILEMKDKKAASEFLKQIFDSRGIIKISTADSLIIPNDNKSIYNPFTILFHRFAPYFLDLGQEIGLYGRVDPEWRSKIKIPEIFKQIKLPRILKFNIQETAMKMKEGDPNVLLNTTPTGIDRSLSFREYFPWFSLRTLFFTEHNNKYLNKYRNKYTFYNLVASELYGVIFSRLYAGTWLMDNIVQDFKWKYHPLSLAAKITRDNPNVNTFTGTSYAFHEMSKLLRRYSKIKTKRHAK